MSLLEDARRLADKPPMTERRCYECAVCGGCFEDHCLDPHGHAPGCLWLALPRIVAALEATQALIDFGFVAEYHDGDYGEYNAARCGACSNLINDPSDHAPDCRGVALVMALKGDAPTA